MITTRKPHTSAVILALGLGMALAASAQSTWDVRTIGSGGDCTGSGASYGNSYNCAGAVISGGTAAATTVNVSAWSNDRGTNGAAITGPAGHWANAYISNQGSSGFGAASRTEIIGVSSPNHAFDSIAPGTFDMALLSFNEAIVLQQFKFGWTGKSAYVNSVQQDSDVVVMRWNGSTGPVLANAGSATEGSKDMLNSTIGAGGWELVNAFADTVAGTTYNTGADSLKGSSYWLIAAYNTTMANKGWTVNNDAFKLNFLKTADYTCLNGGAQNQGGGCGGTTTGQVPEPGSLALAAIAALGAFGARRRPVRALH